SGSVKLLWALASGVSTTGWGAWPRRGLPVRSRAASAAARPLDLRVCLSLCLQAPHGRLNLHQALRTTRQRGGPSIPPPAAEGRFLRGVLLICLRHQGLNLLAQTLHSLLHIPITHRLVP